MSSPVPLLEDELQPDEDAALFLAGLGRVDLAEDCACRGDVGARKVWRVGGAFGFASELDLQLFVDLEVFDHRHVPNVDAVGADV